MLLDVNPNECNLSEHISTKVEVNKRIISTFNHGKSIWVIKPGAKFET